MKVHKNFLGTGGQDKIHVDEIAVAPGLLLGGAVIVESGSNSNGEYVRFGDGLQVCWISPIVLTYTGAHMLEKTWTFPKSFSKSPFCKPNAIDWAPNQGSRGLDIIAYAPSVSSARIVAHAIASGPFSSGDTWTVQAVAIGRWK